MVISLLLAAVFSLFGVVDNGSSTVLLCTLDNSDSKTLTRSAVSKDIRVEVDGMGYKLKKTIHLPVYDEADAKYAYVREGEKLNFALVFETFPSKDGFDLVDPGCDGGNFSLAGLNMPAQKERDSYVDSFIASTPYTEYGKFYRDGLPVSYVEDDILRFELNLTQMYESAGGWHQTAWFEIYNRSGEVLHMSARDIRTSGTRAVGKNRKIRNAKVQLLSAEKADRVWHEYDQDQLIKVRERSEGEVLATTSAYAAMNVAEGLLGQASLLAMLGRIGITAMQDSADRNAVEPELEEKNRYRNETMEYYLTDADIEPGSTESFFGLVSFDVSEDQNSVDAEFKVGERTYTFNW